MSLEVKTNNEVEFIFLSIGLKHLSSLTSIDI